MNLMANRRMDHDVRASICLFGAPGTNPNLGLDALMRGAMAAIAAARPDLGVTVFDAGRGARPGTFVDEDGQQHPFTYHGARYSRKVLLPESFAAMHFALRVSNQRNAGVQKILRSIAVLDVSEGDSFSDIYGDKVFRAVCAPKRFALAARRPLILLPQTYGPFRSTGNAERARRLVLGARQAWARDADSHNALQDLLGPAFNPARHREGVDLAFLLPTCDPVDLPSTVTRLLDEAPSVVGVNLSGLLWNTPARFGLATDYRRVMALIVEDLVQAGHRVLMIPHVMGDQAGGEADTLAIEEFLATLPTRTASAVTRLVEIGAASQAKGVIASCAFFVGTRMHSTIAALSSGVPCVGLAYSPKYQGVFASAGLGEGAVDLRQARTEEIRQAVSSAVDSAPAWRQRLELRIPEVRRRARQQMADILNEIDEP